MNTQDNNKLIAEFMGYKVVDKPKVVNGENFFEYIGENGNYTYCNSLLRYNNQWDWLMPVVEKCFEVTEDGQMIDIMHHLQVADKDGVYKAVVEFINQYNTEQLHEWARINLLPQENAETRLRFAEGIENYDEDYIKEHKDKRKNK